MSRFPFRAILAGIFLGSAIFFFPFIPGFLFAVLITAFFVRLFFFRRRFFGYGRSYYDGFREPFSSFSDDRYPTIPIDGRGSYATPIYGSTRSFPIS